MTLKAYTKGERVLRFEAVVHNTRDLGCGWVVARFQTIIARLQDILERFLTMFDCVDVTFVSNEILDHLPLPSMVGKTRVGGLDINKPRIRSVLAAVLALAASPSGFSVTQVTAKVRAMATQTEHEYTVRHAAYDLK